jgi:hypothetical protein
VLQSLRWSNDKDITQKPLGVCTATGVCIANSVHLTKVSKPLCWLLHVKCLKKHLQSKNHQEILDDSEKHQSNDHQHKMAFKPYVDTETRIIPKLLKRYIEAAYKTSITLEKHQMTNCWLN